jgi:hypothetical protein
MVEQGLLQGMIDMKSRRLSKPPAAKARRDPYRIEPLESRIAPAAVTTLVVSNLKDITNTGHTTGSLRDALTLADLAAGPVAIVFDVSSHGKMVPLHGLITLSPALGALPAITNDVTITAPGITLNAGGKMQGLSITNDTTGVLIKGLAIANGSAAAGGDLSITGGVNIALTGVKLTGGKATTGGGLYVNDGGATITITNSIITGNHATGLSGASGGNTSHGYAGEGGGIANLGGTVVITGKSQIAKNSATGGVGAAGGYGGGAAAGGGIFNADTLSITSSTVSGNTVTGGNGGAATNYSYSAKTTTTTYATAGGYGGNAYGGGVANSGGAVTIQKSVISGNSVHGGNGTSGGTAAVGKNGTNFYVANNTPYAAGNGTYGGNGSNGGSGGNGVGAGVGSVGPGTVSIVQSSISGNIAVAGHAGNGSAGGKGGNGGAGGSYAGTTYYAGTGGNGGYGGNGGNGGLGAGGGVYCSGALTIHTSTISGNTATSGKAGTLGAGGAAGTGYNGGGTAGTIGLAGTYLAGRGGGVDSEGSTVLLSQITVAKNTATFGGGVSVYQDTSAAIHNCTIAVNTAKNTSGGGGLFITLDSGSDPVNVVSSIIALNKGMNIDGTLGAGSSNNFTGTSPLLGALAFHAPGTTLTTGVTQTMLPSKLSPAVVGGPGLNPDGLATDQNGRPFGASIEIGSVQTAT